MFCRYTVTESVIRQNHCVLQMPSFFILEYKVDRFMPNNFAAPLGLPRKNKGNHEVHERHAVEFDELSNRVIGCVPMKIGKTHRALGPGLLESAYESRSS